MTHGRNKKNFEIFSALDYIAAITQHIPEQSFQLVRYTTELRRSGNLLMLAGVESNVILKLEKAGLMDLIGKKNVFAARPVLEESLHEALDAAEAWLKKKSNRL
jgi:hypothetical protein